VSIKEKQKPGMLPLLLILSLVAIGAAQGVPPLRSQYATRIGSTPVMIPMRVELLRSCGTPVDLAQPIAGFVCNTNMQRVALACLDTHTRYICDRSLWKAIAK